MIKLKSISYFWQYLINFLFKKEPYIFATVVDKKRYILYYIQYEKHIKESIVLYKFEDFETIKERDKRLMELLKDNAVWEFGFGIKEQYLIIRDRSTK